MEIAVQDWASMLVRWVHIITGIAWIGSSFYFIWLDLSLRQREGMPEGAYGEVWSVHGGGFYHAQKYLVAPKQMPDELHWFKYESYFTWLSGFCLLAIMYYWGAESFLVDGDKMALEAWQAIAISFGFLVSGWIVYDQICKSSLGRNTAVLAVLVFVLVVVSSYGLSQVFSDRAAMLHVGAMIGTMMTGNVFFIIIPNQKIVVEDLKNGRDPDPALGMQAKQRSTHNNYLTLPVLLMMISNHYPMLTGAEKGWMIVALILLIGGIVRHYFNSAHTGASGKALMWQWPVATLLMVGLILLVSIRSGEEVAEEDVISAPQALAIIQTRCVACHTAKPTDPDFEEAPGGLKFDDVESVRKNATRILAQSVLSKAMPLANKTGMTMEERKQLGGWIRTGMPDE
jgi:uncharacterized membrane protein